MYFRVYAPNGEPFDVPRERADRLILEEGWTQTPPAREEPEPDLFSYEPLTIDED